MEGSETLLDDDVSVPTPQNLSVLIRRLLSSHARKALKAYRLARLSLPALHLSARGLFISAPKMERFAKPST
jgi:hypothetical protein